MDWPKLKRDYKGLTVRTVTEIRNGAMIIPAGTVCEVDEWFRGLTLITSRCPHCGVRMFVTRVSQSRVELVEPQAVRGGGNE